MKSVAEIVASKRYHKKLDLLEGIAAGPDDPFSDPAYYPGYIAREEFMKTVVNLMESHGLAALVYPTAQVVPPTRAETDSGQVEHAELPDEHADRLSDLDACDQCPSRSHRRWPSCWSGDPRPPVR